ncbi:MAG: 4a-hydroxytetrahydrobiopterin dehydratase, partial [Planctomycetota bacterium]
IPCHKGTPVLPRDEVKTLLAELGPGWGLTTAGHLERKFEFKDFVQALAFANAVGSIAEEQGHHPEMTVGWGHCRLEIWTHAIGGLARADFVLAAKASRASTGRS